MRNVISACALAVTLGLSSGAFAQPQRVNSQPLMRQTPCLAIKRTDQVFEYRNMKATVFKRGDTRYVGVYGCLASNVPEKVRSVSVSFVALDSVGAPISKSDGQQMMTPTQTIGFWSDRTPAWIVPAAAELLIDESAGDGKVSWIQVSVIWRERTGKQQTEVYLLSTAPNPLQGEVSPETVEGERAPFPDVEARTNCSLAGGRPRFEVAAVELRLSKVGTTPFAFYNADVKVPAYAEMTNAWAIFTAFDRYGNFIGSDGGVVGGQIGAPPPPSTTIPEGFALRTSDFAKVRNRTLITFQWYDLVGCRWTENHFVDAVRVATVARKKR